VNKPLRITAYVAGGLILMGAGAAIGNTSNTATPPAPATVTHTVTFTVTSLVPAPPTTTTPPPAPAAPVEPTSWGTGTYKVGDDIPAGTFVRDGGTGPCYWARLRDDSGTNIIANNFSEGPSRFTTKAGEYVQIRGCTFVKK
jgi:hypothetical protein